LLVAAYFSKVRYVEIWIYYLEYERTFHLYTEGWNGRFLANGFVTGGEAMVQFTMMPGLFLRQRREVGGGK